MPVAKKPLQTLFDALFHGKRSFADFMLGASEDDLGRTHFWQGEKQRDLNSPSERLRAYHRFLRVFLVDFLPIHEPVVFSYRKGASARDAVEKHSHSRHFFVTDIESFFPSVTREIVRQTITDALPLLPIADLEAYLEHVLDYLCVDDALPVGFATSPGLSNAALLRFDRALHDACEQAGVVYTRYADDLVLSSLERGALKAGEGALNALLQQMFKGAFRLHQGKTKYLNIGNKIKLLGLVLLPNGTVSIDVSVKNEIETLLHLYMRDRDRFNSHLDLSPAKTEARLSGLLNYANSVDQAYLDKLRRKYGAATVDLFVHRSFG